MSWLYHVDVREEDDGSFGAYASAMPDAVAGGATREEALAEMALALDAAVRGRIAFGLDLVPPSGFGAWGERDCIALAPALAAKATVYAAWRASGLSKVALAAQLGVNEKEGRRILDPNYPTGLDRLAQAARALGYSLTIGATRVQPA